MSTERRKKQDEAESGAATGRKKSKIRVIRDDDNAQPTQRTRSKIKVIPSEEGDRLTTDEWRRRFAHNLDRLLALVGLSRKDAADEIGIPYPMIRRLVSAGTSRTDERIGDEIKKIADFFTLSEVDDLWRADLVQSVLDVEKGRAFIDKFRPRLLAERERRVVEAQEPKLDELSLLNRALGFEVAAPVHLTGPYAGKVATVLNSDKADTFMQLIDDYYELVRRTANSSDRQTGTGRLPLHG